MNFSKYRKVLYIKSNNYISIVSDIILDITDSYEFNIEITSNGEYIGFFYTFSEKNYLIGTEDVNNGLEFWIGENYYKVPTFRKGIIKVDSIKDGNIYINGKFETSIPYTNSSSSGGIPGYIRKTPKIYDVKIIKESGDLKYHFIPVVDIATNIAGLYDEVNDKFYGNLNVDYKEYTDFSKFTAIEIPEGIVTKIEDSEGRVLWSALPDPNE